MHAQRGVCEEGMAVVKALQFCAFCNGLGLTSK